MYTNSKVAVVGCGSWGKNIVRNFHDLGCLYSVFDERHDLAEEIGQRYGVPVLSYDKIMNDANIDAVAICVSAPEHANLVSRAIDSGKDVFVEKPFTLSLVDSLKLHELALEKDRIIMVGHILRYHPAFEKANGMIQNGDIGKVFSIQTNRSNLGLIRRSESVLWCLAPHDLSMILSVTDGELPESVYTVGQLSLKRDNIHDWATIHMVFKGGLVAQTQVSWLNPFKEQKFIATGSKGAIKFDDCKDWNEKICFSTFEIVQHNVDAPQAIRGGSNFIDIEPCEPLKRECEHFLESLHTRNKPRTNSLEALNVVRVLDAAEKSLFSGEWIKV